MIARLICRLPKWLGGGHRRGKRLSDAEVQPGFVHFECPRCKSRWIRKERKA